MKINPLILSVRVHILHSTGGAFAQDCVELINDHGKPESSGVQVISLRGTKKPTEVGS